MKAKFDLTPRIKELQIATKGLAESGVVGSYKSVFRGHGLEFESYRSYQPDDDASMIDWKASIRSDDILVKQFVEERNRTVFFLVDVSESMMHGSSHAKLKIQYAAELAASLIYAVINAQDRVGWALFGKAVHANRPPAPGVEQFQRFAADVVNPKYYGGVADLKKALLAIAPRLRENSIVIIISDFIDIQMNWDKTLAVLNKKFDIIAMGVHDIFDHTLPNENAHILFEHPSTGEQVIVNVADQREVYEERAQAYDRMLKTKFKKAQVDYLHMMVNDNFVKKVLAFFRKRSLRWQ